MWGGTQRSRDPNNTKALPEKPGQKSKSTQDVAGPREAGILTEQNAVPEKQNQTRVAEPRESGTLTEQNAVPEETGQKSKTNTRGGKGPRDAGTLTNRSSQKIREAAKASALAMHSTSDTNATLSSGASKSRKPCISRKEGKGPR